MEFKVSELEREPIEFDLELAPGAVDLGQEATQVGSLATQGQAEVLHEHRGPKEIVADIRLRGQFAGRFEVPCARCVEPVEIPLAAEFDLIFRPAAADREATERSITAVSYTHLDVYKRQVYDGDYEVDSGDDSGRAGEHGTELAGAGDQARVGLRGPLADELSG